MFNLSILSLTKYICSYPFFEISILSQSWHLELKTLGVQFLSKNFFGYCRVIFFIFNFFTLLFPVQSNYFCRLKSLPFFYHLSVGRVGNLEGLFILTHVITVLYDLTYLGFGKYELDSIELNPSLIIINIR